MCKDVLLTPRPITTAEFQSSNGTGRWRHLQEDLDLEDYEEEEGPYQQRSLMMSFKFKGLKIWAKTIYCRVPWNIVISWLPWPKLPKISAFWKLAMARVSHGCPGWLGTIEAGLQHMACLLGSGQEWPGIVKDVEKNMGDEGKIDPALTPHPIITDHSWNPKNRAPAKMNRERDYWCAIWQRSVTLSCQALINGMSKMEMSSKTMIASHNKIRDTQLQH